MILTCPSCSTRYLVDRFDLREAGRTVRCVRCRHTWWQELPADAEPMAELLRPESLRPIPPGSNLPAFRRARPRLSKKAIGWFALAATVSVLVIALAAFRGPIIAGWPATSRLYAALGAAPEIGGQPIELRDVRTTRIAGETAPTESPGRPDILVEGSVVNVSAAAQPAPALRIALKDAEDRELRALHLPLAQTELAAGESVAFAARVEDAPAAAASLSVTFEQPE